MSLTEIADIVGAALVVVGAFLCLSAAVGLVRFPDILTRMHAATKPQTLGLLVIVLGVAMSLRAPVALGVLFLVAVLQLMTAPVSAHMVARAAYRSNQIENGRITTDELAEDLAKAGFALQAANDDDPVREGEGSEQADLEPSDLDAQEGTAAGAEVHPDDPPSRRSRSGETESAHPEDLLPQDRAPEEILDTGAPRDQVPGESGNDVNKA